MNSKDLLHKQLDELLAETDDVCPEDIYEVMRDFNEKLDAYLRSRNRSISFDKYDAIELLNKKWTKRELPDLVVTAKVLDMDHEPLGIYFDYERKDYVNWLPNLGARSELMILIGADFIDASGRYKTQEYCLLVFQRDSDGSYPTRMIRCIDDLEDRPRFFDHSRTLFQRFSWDDKTRGYQYKFKGENYDGCPVYGKWHEVITSMPKVDEIIEKSEEYLKFPIKRTLREINTLTLCSKRGSPLLGMLCKDVFMLILQTMWNLRYDSAREPSSD